MTWQPDRPYNQLPPLPPSAVSYDTLKVLKACIPVRAALAELKQAGQLFRTTLEKALFSSPAACLSTVQNRMARLQKRLARDPNSER